jgi:O-antigen/teichoic acid export membrane protein
MAEQSLKDKTVKGTIWSAVERLSSQMVQFIVMLVLARLLTPHDYGIIGMLAVFIALSQSIIDSGFTQALIRKKNVTDKDFCTVFFFNIGVSVFLYFVFFLLAPFVENFYREPNLTRVMRILCLVIIINAFTIVPKAIFTIDLDFKIQTAASLSAAVFSGITGVLIALRGLGVWALVGQQLSYAIVSTTVLCFYSKWKPQFVFSICSFKEMFSFGSKLMIVGIINTFFLNLYPIVIGKLYAGSMLGYYTRGQHFAELPSMNITSIVQRVTYPVMCKMQEDSDCFVSFFSKVLKTVAFFFFPFMCILAGISIPLVEIVLGHKWHYCGVLMVPICFSMMWYPFNALNLNILEVVGQSNLFLKLEIIKKTISVVVLCVSVPFGVDFLCYTQSAVSLIYVVINAWYTKDYVSLTFWEQMKMYLPSLLLSLLIFALILITGKLVDNNWTWLIGGLLIGWSLYLFGSRIFGFSEVKEAKEILKFRRKE